MKTVNFTEMKNGTKNEYLLLDEYEQEYIKGTADRILKFKILPISPNYDIPKVEIFVSKVEAVSISHGSLIDKFKNEVDFSEDMFTGGIQIVKTKEKRTRGCGTSFSV